MDPETQEYLKDLKKRAQAARNWANLTSLAGFAALPVSGVFMVLDEKWSAISALCWFVGHFVGYVAKCAQVDMTQAEYRASITEEAVKTMEKGSAKQNPATARFQNRISLN